MGVRRGGLDPVGRDGPRRRAGVPDGGERAVGRPVIGPRRCRGPTAPLAWTRHPGCGSSPTPPCRCCRGCSRSKFARPPALTQTVPVMTTLAIDCGGGGIKASVLDEAGPRGVQPIRVPTPSPMSPSRFVDTLKDLADRLPDAERATVGMPGMIRHGVVVATPHYITKTGPRSKVEPELLAAWSSFDARSALTDAFGVPTLVLNDAEVHGAGVVAGTGLELV